MTSQAGGALAGYWYLGIVTEQAAMRAKLLLGVAVGGSAATTLVLLWFGVSETLMQKNLNLIGVFYYGAFVALFGGILGAIVMSGASPFKFYI